jgi:16S rRNA processing protein RimM
VSADRQDQPVTLAAVAGAHGVMGEVRLRLFGEGAASLKRYRAFNDSKLTVQKLRDDGKGGAVARFAEVADRNAAEALRGTLLTVKRSELPPLADGEYYHADLLGLDCIDPVGELLGTCTAVENYGAGDVLEVTRPDEDGKPGKTFMVPMRPEAVPEWGQDAGGRIVIAAGWADQ